MKIVIALSVLFATAAALFLFFYLFRVLGHLHVTLESSGVCLLQNSGVPLTDVRITARRGDGGIASAISIAHVPRGESVIEMNLPADARVTGIQVRGRRFGVLFDHFACLEVPRGAPPQLQDELNHMSTNHP